MVDKRVGPEYKPVVAGSEPAVGKRVEPDSKQVELSVPAEMVDNKFATAAGSQVVESVAGQADNKFVVVVELQVVEVFEELLGSKLPFRRSHKVVHNSSTNSRN